MLFTNTVVRQYLVVIAINLNCLSFGLGLTWVSPVFVKLEDPKETVLPKPLEQEEGSWVASVSFLTGTFGYMTTFALIDLIGRKNCVILSSLVKLISALLFLFAHQVWMLVLGRVMNGISEGVMLGVVPVYSSEIASREIRGALGCMLQIMSSIGSLIMLSVGPFISYFELNLMLTLLYLGAGMPTLFVPDSPSFLYARGQQEQSKNVLVFLRGTEFQADEEFKEYSTNKSDGKQSLWTILRMKSFRKSLGLSGFLAVFVILTGYNCVTLYLQTILNTTQTDIRSEVASGIIGAIQLLASFITLLSTDRFGRKPILVLTLLGMALGMIGLGTFFKLTGTGTEVSGFLNFLPLLSLVLVVFCYSGGMGSLIWVIIAELFDDRSRGIGVALTLLIGTLPAFLTVQYFSTFIDLIGAAPTFWASAVLCAVLAAFVGFRLPETKGKSFAEIQQDLGKENKS